MAGRKRTSGNGNHGNAKEACETKPTRTQSRTRQRSESDGNRGEMSQRFQNEESDSRRQMRKVKDEAQQTAQEIKEETKQKARELTESAKQQVSEAAREAKHELSEQARRAKAEGREFVNRQKDWAADEASHLGGAVRQAADRLHADGDETLAGYADTAARKIDEVASYLRGRDASHLIDDVERLTRSRPEIIFGGLFIVGLGVARFLKASGARRRQAERSSRPQMGYASTGYATPNYASPSYASTDGQTQHVDRPYAASPTTAPGYAAEPYAFDESGGSSAACPTPSRPTSNM